MSFFTAHRARIARSLVSIFILGFTQTVIAPVVAPNYTTPKAEAAATTNSYTYTSNTTGTTYVVPSGVTYLSFQVQGGAGGNGGADGSTGGTISSDVGFVSAVFNVKPGDVIQIFPGNQGANGGNSVNSSGGGTGGAGTVADSPLSINGSYYANSRFTGGAGGNAGNGGAGSYSGAGGGGGAASVVAINYKIVLVAGGGGGGGGSGDGASNSAIAWDGTFVSSGSFIGGAGSSPAGNVDGGGGGGGGGGYMAGAGGASVYRSTEYAGKGGSRGSNFVDSSGSSALTTTASPNGVGFVNMTINPDAVSSCTTDLQTNDIYTIVKVTQLHQCTWSVPASVSVIDIFAVGGGGGGGGDGGGGGGGGAAISRTAIAVTPSSTLNLKVGYGGFGGSWGGKLSSQPGDSTTVVLSSGSVFAALGGSAGVSTPGGAGGAGGTASNGGFAGGAGGTGTSVSNTVGAAGKRGISNYYYGTQTTYGGGGGGGTNTGSAVQTAAAGFDGGGRGAYANTTSTNVPGESGTANTGGGGGGGAATGSGLKIHGGSGGSGIILIRYATNSANEFPASLTSAIAQRWLPGDLQILDSAREGFIDSSGNFVSSRAIEGTVVMDTATIGTGSSKSFLQLKGDTNAYFNLENLPSANNYTLFTMAKYQTNSVGRIISSNSGNWLSGFWAGHTGVAHHNAWLTDAGYGRNDVWALSADQQYTYRFNGVTRLNRNASAMSSTGAMGINTRRDETSSWQLGEVLVFNRELNLSEIYLVEKYLARVYGITLTENDASSETDTSLSLAGSTFVWAKGSPRVNLSDTFTVEAWVKPTSTCDAAHVCYFYAQEAGLVMGIQYGALYYALYGLNTAWEWTATNIKVPSGEWHHVALSKELTGNRSGSLKFYLDGQLSFTKIGSPYVASTASPTVSDANVVYPASDIVYIGYRSSPNQYFYGNIDEVRVWRGFRTQTEIQSDLNSYGPNDNPNLRLYLDFNKRVSSSTMEVLNNSTSGEPAFAMLQFETPSYSDVKVVSTTNPYTTINFPRTYLTSVGGWKVPDSITAVSALVVGGGGGGGYNSGGGGSGGGVTYTPRLSVRDTLTVVVGAGGIGANSSGSAPNAGLSSTLQTVTSPGGNPGGNYPTSQLGGTAVSTSSGSWGAGGRGAPNNTTSGTAGSSGAFFSIEGSSVTYGGGGGGGGWAGNTGGGTGGAGGGGAGGITNSQTGKNGTANLGGGGGGGSASGYAAGSGGSGVVIVRWITALKPAYTKPTNAYLNVGMTETFTTNVSQDSATVGLTRTFLWESITPTSNGNFTTLKQGTGASNAAFSWVPSDTSTSGSGYLYRLTVTDSDTAGLYISDSSTAYAVINQPLNVSGTSSIAKTINVARNETFTITLGTPTYRASLSPVIPGISVDTSTAGYAVLKISDTATVGTWLETLTVTDSVSASIEIPLTIKITAPPNLVNTGEIVTNGLILNIDAANTASYNRATGTWSDLSGSNRFFATNGGGGIFSDDFSGLVKLTPSSYQAVYTSGVGKLTNWTIDSWIRIDANLSAQNCVITSEYVNSSINYFLCLDSGRTVFTGFYTGSNYTYMRTTYVVPLNTWVHLSGVWNGSTTKLYINGAIAPGTEVYNNAGTNAPAPDGSKTYIGKWWDTGFQTTASSYTPMTIGSVRLYNIPLLETQVASNFNATKVRFDASNLTQLRPSQKYGVLTLESFTATSGGDTKTVSFSASPRQGVVWDTTSTPGQIKLSVGESLSVGTYYDTVTVTDNFGASTYLPLTFTVTKADTITVTSGPSLTTVYTGSATTNVPVARITGLVGKDTATVLTRYETSTVGKTCALGGTCVIGDTGPGGGVVFYVSNTPINAVPGISDGGIYLELAPVNWNNNGTNEVTTAFATDSRSVSGTSGAIGTGAENSRIWREALGSSASAVNLALDRTLNGKSDWFVPSYQELVKAIENIAPLGLSNPPSGNLWSSTQTLSNSALVDNAWASNPPVLNTLDKTDNRFRLRPIRAFGGTTVTPTEVDTYTAVGTNINFSIGALDNYQAVTYDTSTLKITQANQNKLSINLYGAIAGTPFLIQTSGGSGTGAVTETVTAGGTATNCALSNHVLSNSSPNTVQVTCNIKVTKASSRNYFAESLDATVYFMLYVNNMPTNQVGSGSTIALNGATSLTIDDSATVRAPLISSISISGTTVTINGEGFGSSAVSVKFERNIITSATPSGTDAAGIITVTLPGGARSGYVLVTLPSGAKATSPYLTLP